MLKSMKYGTLVLIFAFFLSPSARAQWEPDTRFTFNNNSSWTSLNNARCIAGSVGGLVHAVWYDYRSGTGQIYYKRSSDCGTTWSPDSCLTASSNAQVPCIATSGSTVHIVWQDYRNGPSGNSEIYYKRSTDGGLTWLADSRLTIDSLESQLPSISAFGNEVHVAWSDSRDGNFEVYYKRSTDGGITWFPDTRLTYDTSWAAGPSICISGQTVHVVWFQAPDGFIPQIFYKRSTDQGLTWLSDTCLNERSYTQYPSMCLSDSVVFVVWEDFRLGNRTIFYKRSSDLGASWSPDSALTEYRSLSRFPFITASGSNFHLVWKEYRDRNNEIYYKQSSDWGITWSQDIRLTFDTSDVDYPSVSASDSVVHVIWTDFRDCGWPNGEIYYKRNPTGNVGVEESSGRFQPPTSNLSFSVVPNPFTSFTTVPGHSSDRFTLYDVSGRWVGSFKGDKIGAGLSAGVYFLKPEAQDAKPLRIVKLR